MPERALKTRQAILAAVTRPFARNGLGDTRIDALASRANVNRQRLYAYFGSMEMLFEAAMPVAFTQADAESERLIELDEDDLP